MKPHDFLVQSVLQKNGSVTMATTGYKGQWFCRSKWSYCRGSQWPYGTFSFKTADFTDTILRIYTRVLTCINHIEFCMGMNGKNDIKFAIKQFFSATTFFISYFYTLNIQSLL